MKKYAILLALAFLPARMARAVQTGFLTVPTAATGTVQFNQGGLFAGTTNFTFSTGTKTLFITSVTAQGIQLLGILACSGALQTDAAGNIFCGAGGTSGGGGGAGFYFDGTTNRGMSTMTIVGASGQFNGSFASITVLFNGVLSASHTGVNFWSSTQALASFDSLSRSTANARSDHLYSWVPSTFGLINIATTSLYTQMTTSAAFVADFYRAFVTSGSIISNSTSTLLAVIKSSAANLSDNTHTINVTDNPVSWKALKDVPAGFADGTDDGSGGAGGLTPDQGATTYYVLDGTQPVTGSHVYHSTHVFDGGLFSSSNTTLSTTTISDGSSLILSTSNGTSGLFSLTWGRFGLLSGYGINIIGTGSGGMSFYTGNLSQFTINSGQASVSGIYTGSVAGTKAAPMYSFQTDNGIYFPGSLNDRRVAISVEGKDGIMVFPEGTTVIGGAQTPKATLSITTSSANGCFLVISSGTKDLILVCQDSTSINNPVYISSYVVVYSSLTVGQLLSNGTGFFMGVVQTTTDFQLGGVKLSVFMSTDSALNDLQNSSGTATAAALAQRTVVAYNGATPLGGNITAITCTGCSQGGSTFTIPSGSSGGGSGVALYDGANNVATSTASLQGPYGLATVTSGAGISSWTILGSTSPYAIIPIPAAAFFGVSPSSASPLQGGIVYVSTNVAYDNFGDVYHQFNAPNSTRSFAMVNCRMPYDWDGSSISVSFSWFASTGEANTNCGWSLQGVAISSGSTIYQAATSSVTVFSTWIATNTEIQSDFSAGYNIAGSPRPGSRCKFIVSAYGGGFKGLPNFTEVLICYRKAVWDGKPR